MLYPYVNQSFVIGLFVNPGIIQYIVAKQLLCLRVALAVLLFANHNLVFVGGAGSVQCGLGRAGDLAITLFNV